MGFKLVFSGFLVILYLGIPLREIQVITATLFLLLTLSMIYSQVCRWAVMVKRNTKTVRVHQGQELEITFKLVNRSFLPVFFLQVEDNPSFLYAKEKPFWFVSLRPFEVKTITYRVMGNKRGKFSLGPVRLAGTDPLGILPWKRKSKVEPDVIIYPAVTHVDLEYSKGLPSGNLSSHNPIFEDTTRYRSFREYLPGDDLKRINWKVSARMGKMYTTEFSPALYFPSIILLNISPDDYPLRYKFSLIEKAIQTAASLVFYCVNLKQRCGLLSTGYDEDNTHLAVPVRGGYENAVSILEKLAIVRENSDYIGITNLLMQGQLEIPWGSRIMYVGPPLPESELGELEFLLNKGASMDLIYITQNTKHDIHIPNHKSFQIYTTAEQSDEITKRY